MIKYALKYFYKDLKYENICVLIDPTLVSSNSQTKNTAMTL